MTESQHISKITTKELLFILRWMCVKDLVQKDDAIGFKVNLSDGFSKTKGNALQYQFTIMDTRFDLLDWITEEGMVPQTKIADENFDLDLTKNANIISRAMIDLPQGQFKLVEVSIYGDSKAYFAPGNKTTKVRIKSHDIEDQNYDINQQDSMGRTLLHFAAMANNLQVIGSLIHLGANVDILDRANRAFWSEHYTRDSIKTIKIEEIVKFLVAENIAEMNRPAVSPKQRAL